MTDTNRIKGLLAETGEPGQDRTNVVDLLTDLMHHTEESGLNFDDILASARNHFSAEGPPVPKHATLADVAHALRGHSLAATVIEADPERHVMAGINVWEGPDSTGYAYTTVYAPANGSGWVWGHQYQHGAPDHVDAKWLADQISQTIFADPRPPRS